ncbi:MAG: PEP/pyruvate-binding domain-containing protein [Rhodocyclaceae bacterium]|nr:PEP/pyruvate-binding domain-containing protein [Rhodocyclaceae bacterium]
MKLFDFFSATNSGSRLSASDSKRLVKYRHFRTLLNHNRDALRHMTEMEKIYYSDQPIDTKTVKQSYANLFEHVCGLATALNALSADRFPTLPNVCRAIDAEIALALTSRRASMTDNMVMPLEDLGADMVGLAGAKAVNLAVMKNTLKLPVPDGFVITAGATSRFLEESGLRERIREGLAQLSPDDLAGLETGSTAIRKMVLDIPVPRELAAEIGAAYAALESKTRSGVRIAVRSSAVGEDGAASFAGQYSTELNVTRDGLLDAFKRVVASKYSPRAISYRLLCGLDDEDTPMSVIGLTMVDAKASGVMYTIDPATLDDAHVKISSLWGLGEQLVGGDATPDSFFVNKQTGEISERQIARKAAMLISLAGGGTHLEETAPERQTSPSLTDEALRQLRTGGVSIEAHFQASQDIEWAIDADDRLFFLQTRPLHLAPKAPQQPTEDLSGLENILRSGVAASHGITAGRVFVARNENDLSAIPDHAILVTPTASPSYAAVMGRIDALITDVGSITSHLSSVAREFGIPAIVDAGAATKILAHGEPVTVVAETPVAVYRGMVEQLRDRMRPAKKLYVGSPAHKKLRAILDRISPLNLTDRHASAFSVAGCRSFHDVIRFCHEHAMREMFDISSTTGNAGAAVKVVTHLPLAVYVIDLGGGLQGDRPLRKSVSPEAIASLPMQSIWKGLTHPGISWEGTMNFASSRFMTLMASIATSELGPEPGGDSYVLLSRDYMNFSAKFGYHYATIDALCSNEANHNYIAMQFSGGAGNYFGRSLRVRFLGTVLERLGFQVTLQGDLIEASFSRHGQESTEDRLDQLGRLLASCRLLDMTLSNEDAVNTLADAFMGGDYDFLKPRDALQPETFYTQHGHWQRHAIGETTCLHQSGRSSKQPVTDALSGIIGKTIGTSYQELLDSIGAYFYFPLAIAKNSETGNGRIQVEIKPENGRIDQAGGVVFGLKNAANYFVFRINALEHNAILFEFVNGKRIERGKAVLVIKSGRWYRLRVDIADRTIHCGIDEQPAIEYCAETSIKGHVGVWTKADSSTWFRPLTVEDATGVRTFGY